MDVLGLDSVYSATGFAGAGHTAAPLEVPPAIASTAGPGRHDLSAQGLISLRNPLTIFGLFAAVTFGLIAVSSSVRVGKARASASIGRK